MAALLTLRDVHAGYGRIEVLRGVDLEVPRGAVVALVGPNGAGKTTTLRTIAGQLPTQRGVIEFDGRRIETSSAYERARRGLVLVPEGRGVFPGLDVRSNLEIAARADRRASSAQRDRRLEEVLELFPRLAERLDQRAGTMSGGEQQMLALSRAFLCGPELVMMDEISMGLAPKIVEDLFDAIAQLRDRGTTLLLVEQFLTYVVELADLAYVLDKGTVRFVGEPWELQTDRIDAGYFSTDQVASGQVAGS